MLRSPSAPLWRLTEADEHGQKSSLKGLPCWSISSPYSQDFQRGLPELSELHSCMLMITEILVLKIMDVCHIYANVGHIFIKFKMLRLFFRNRCWFFHD